MNEAVDSVKSPGHMVGVDSFFRYYFSQYSLWNQFEHRRTVFRLNIGYGGRYLGYDDNDDDDDGGGGGGGGGGYGGGGGGGGDGGGGDDDDDGDKD